MVTTSKHAETNEIRIKIKTSIFT